MHVSRRRFLQMGCSACLALAASGALRQEASAETPSSGGQMGVLIPSVGEFIITLTLVSGGVAAFALIARFFPVFSREVHAEA